MKTKLFFFDLDGTLLTDQKTITPATYEALKRWHAAGHRIAISSGRALPSIFSAILENGLSEFSPIAIAFNGAQAYDLSLKRDLYKETLTLKEAFTAAKAAKAAGIHIQSYDDTHILSPAVTPEVEYYTRVIKMPVRILPDFPEGITEPPCKMLCIELNDRKKIEILADTLRGLFAPADGISESRVTVLFSNAYYLEVFPSCAGKGTAVKKLSDLLGVPRENTYAAGDEENDISMIRAAGTGIAMCNGNPMTFDAADLITETDNNHDGLAVYLDRFC